MKSRKRSDFQTSIQPPSGNQPWADRGAHTTIRLLFKWTDHLKVGASQWGPGCQPSLIKMGGSD